MKRRGEDAGINLQQRREQFEAEDAEDEERQQRGDDGGGGDVAAWMADAETLKSRSIVKSKRRANGDGAGASSGGGLFAGVNLLAGTAKPAGGLFAGVDLTAGFGAPMSAPSAAAKAPGPRSAGADAGAGAGASSAAGGPAAGAAGGAASSRSEEALKDVAALNASFCNWITEQVKKNESAPLLEGVRKYIEYADKLTKALGAAPEAKSGTNAPPKSPPAAPARAPAAGGLFTGPTPAATAASSATATSSAPLFGAAIGGSRDGGGSGGLFGTLASGPASSSTLFGAGKPAAAGGLFGSSGGGSGSGSSSGLFGSLSSAGAGASSSLFGGAGGPGTGSSLFGGAGVSGSGLFGGAAPAKGGNEEEEDGDGDSGDEEPAVDEEKLEVGDSLAEDETLLHKVKTKVMFLGQDSKWAQKGLGDLSVIKLTAGGGLLVLRGETGRITCNIPLYATMAPSVDAASKSVKFAAVSYKEGAGGKPEAENQGKPVPFMLRVKTAKDAEVLRKHIQSALPTP
jgi:hypothetical protein